MCAECLIAYPLTAITRIIYHRLRAPFVGPPRMDRRHYRLSPSDRLTGLPLRSVDLLFRFIAKRNLARRVDRASLAFTALSFETTDF